MIAANSASSSTKAASGKGFGRSAGSWVTTDLSFHLLEITRSKSTVLISAKEYSVLSVVIGLISSFFPQVSNLPSAPVPARAACDGNTLSGYWTCMHMADRAQLPEGHTQAGLRVKRRGGSERSPDREATNDHIWSRVKCRYLADSRFDCLLRGFETALRGGLALPRARTYPRRLKNRSDW